METSYRGIIIVKHFITNRGDELIRAMHTLLKSMPEVANTVLARYETCYYIFFESSSEIDVNAFYNNKSLSKYISDEEAMQKWVNMNEDESFEADPPLVIQDDELRIVLYSLETGVFNVYATEWEKGSDTFPSLEEMCDFGKEDIFSVYNLLKEGLSTSDIILKYEGIVDASVKQAKKDRRMDYTKTFAKRESRYFYIESVIE